MGLKCPDHKLKGLRNVNDAKIEPIKSFELGGWQGDPNGKNQALVDSAKVLVDEDWSEPYEVDQAQILQLPDGTFLYATASGCSCWEGNWQYEQYATFNDLANGIRFYDRQYNVGWTRTDSMLAKAAQVLGL